MENIAQINKEKYSHGYYDKEKIIRKLNDQSKDFFDVLARIKMDLVKESINNNSIILDLCCATGLHLIALSPSIKEGFGLDFSKRYINEAEKYKNTFDNIHFLYGDAKNQPFENDFFDLIYCFSSLYHIPDQHLVVSEISRILKKKGLAILDFGILHSLNTLVSKAHAESAIPCHISFSAMKKMLKANDFKTIRIRSFNILPYWGNKPQSIKWLLHPFWKKVMQKQFFGVMLDQMISSLPFIRRFAFRQLVVVRKK
jgi:ubiquinone/menaquinone biosynthesis C-methylase UbiE